MKVNEMEDRHKSNWPVALAATGGIAGAVMLIAHLTGGDGLETRIATTPARPDTAAVVVEQPQREEYLVMRGDTAYKICQDYGITFGELREYNPGVEDWNALDVGQRLYLGDTDD